MRKPDFVESEQRCRLACTYVLSDKHLYYLPIFSILSKQASCKISIFELVSIAEQIDLKLTQLATLKTGFLAIRTIVFKIQLLSTQTTDNLK